MRKRDQAPVGNYTAFGYAAATAARNLGIGPGHTTADYHTTTDRETLLEMSRRMARDNSIFSGAKARMADNILGPDGFTLQARVMPPRRKNGSISKSERDTAEEINRKIETELWPQFADDPDVRGFYSFSELSRLVVEDLIEAGDIGAILLKNGQIQMIESEQIGSSKAKNFDRRIEQGIELNKQGKPVGYWIKQPSDHSYTDGVRITSDDFVYVHGPARRITMTRPVPPFTPTLANIHRLNDILTAEAVAWQMLARFAVTINRSDADIEGYDLSEDEDSVAGAARERYYDTTAAELSDRVVQTEMGTMFWGAPGEKVEGVKHDVPGANFTNSVTTYLRLIGMQIGLPLEILLLDWSKTNFSSARASIEQAKLTLRRWQKTVEKQFHRRIYNWKVAGWVQDGKLPNRPDIYAHEWVPHPMPWVDLEREAKANSLLLETGQITYGESLKAQGRERVDENYKREVEVRDAIEISQRIEKDTGVPIPPEYFMGRQVGKTASAEREKAAGDSSKDAKDSAPPVDSEETNDE